MSLYKNIEDLCKNASEARAKHDEKCSSHHSDSDNVKYSQKTRLG